MDALITNYQLPQNLSEDKWMRECFSPSGEPTPIVEVVSLPEPCQDSFIVYAGCIQTIRIWTNGELKEQRFQVDDLEITDSVALDHAPADFSLPAKLDLIRMQFGIGTKHLAEAVGVERQTIYDWQNEVSKPHEKRRERIETLVGLAKNWSSLSERSLGMRAFEPVEGGRSVMDLLKEKDLNVEEIKTVLRRWADSHTATKARLRQKAITIRDGMASRGFKPLPDEVIDQTLRDLAKSSM